MKREWLLMGAVVVITLVMAVGVIRWLAPGLLGVPTDMQVVQVSKKVPPFFENVFRPEDFKVQGMHINDPYTSVRHRPLIPEANLSGEHGLMWGPLDLLGFRNRSIPVVADVVVIGDSQTFGSNVPMDYNWPSYLERGLADRRAVVYNMAVGGWGGIQYMDMFSKALAFRPRTVVVAFSSPADAWETLRLAYSFPRWAEFRQSDQAPEKAPSHWPPTEESMWPVRFADGQQTVFTASTRLAPNHRDYPATLEGYAIMAETGRRMAAMAVEAGIEVIFTIVPTKETVFAAKVRAEGLTPPADYTTLIKHEGKNIAELVAIISTLPGARYVDIITPMQQAALGRIPLYPPLPDGHPIAPGYAVIANTLLPEVAKRVPFPPGNGIVPVLADSGDALTFALVRGRGIRFFTEPDLVTANGWKIDLRRLEPKTIRDVAPFAVQGMINRVVPERFGPQSFAPAATK